VTASRRRVGLSNPSWWILQFPFDRELIAEVRSMGAVAVPRSDKWTLPANPGYAAQLVGLGFTGHGHPTGATLDEVAATAARLIALSSALEPPPEFEVPGLTRTLAPHQAAAVAYVQEQRRVIVADPMGAGKTFEGWAAVHACDAYPALWVSPAKLRTNAAVEALDALPTGTRVAVVLPRSTEPAKVERARARGILPMLGRPRPGAADVYVTGYPLFHTELAWWKGVGLKGLILDESQLCKSRDRIKGCPICRAPMRRGGVCSGPGRHPVLPDRRIDLYAVLWTRAADELIDSMGPDPMILELSGTPNKNTNADWPTQLDLIRRLHQFGGERNVLFRYCDPMRVAGRWQFRGGSNYAEFDRLKRATGYVHRTREAIHPNLPPLVRSPLLLDLDDDLLVDYRAAERDLIRFAGQRAAKLAAAAGEDPGSASWEARLRAEAGFHLVRLGTLARLAALAKVPAAVEWVTDFQAANPEAKLIVFAHHRDVCAQLAAAFDCPRIDGSTTADPQDIKDRFQSDPSMLVLVVGITAGGVGLTLTAAHDELFVEQVHTAGDHDQAESRAYARMNDPHGVTATYLLAADTMDEDQWLSLAAKRVTTEAGRSGDPEAIRKAEELKRLGPAAVAGDLLVQLARRSGVVG